MKRFCVCWAALLVIGMAASHGQSNLSAAPLSPELTGILTNMSPATLPVYVPQAINPTPTVPSVIMPGQTNVPPATVVRRPGFTPPPTPNQTLRGILRPTTPMPMYTTPSGGTTNTVPLIPPTPSTTSLYPPPPTISTNGVPALPHPWPQQNPLLKGIEYKW